MGMFDWVKVEMECPFCGEYLTKDDIFQTKDTDCTMDVKTIDNPELKRFYGNCPSCKKWIECTRTTKPNPSEFRRSEWDIEGVSHLYD